MTQNPEHEPRGRKRYLERKATDPEWWDKRKQRSRENYYASWEGRMTHLLSLAKYRGRKKGIPVTVTRQELLDALIKQQFRCARTDLLLSIERRTEEEADSRNPWAPSLDRIDPKLGYVPGNVQIVCLMYNLAKNSSDDHSVRMFADALLRKPLQVHRP